MNTQEIEKIVDFAIPDKSHKDRRWELRSRLCALIAGENTHTKEVLIEGLRETKRTRKIPWQALNFGDNCPDCGREPNQTYVDEKCKQIADQAFGQAIALVEEVYKSE